MTQVQIGPSPSANNDATKIEVRSNPGSNWLDFFGGCCARRMNEGGRGWAVAPQEAPEIWTKMGGITPRPPKTTRTTRTTKTTNDKNDENDENDWIGETSVDS